MRPSGVIPGHGHDDYVLVQDLVEDLDQTCVPGLGPYPGVGIHIFDQVHFTQTQFDSGLFLDPDGFLGRIGRNQLHFLGTPSKDKDGAQEHEQRTHSMPPINY